MFDPLKIAKSPAMLRKLFANEAIWKAFEAERSRRDIEWRARRIEEMEQTVRSGGASRQDHINLNVAKAVQDFFVEREKRERNDVIGATVGTA